MREKTDAELLGEYASNGSEDAFRELVGRHAALIYSAALRQVTSPDLARDITQAVFTDLAHKAGILRAKNSGPGFVLGWLYRGTRFACLNLLRDQQRRQQREKELAMHMDSATEADPEWERISAVLDPAMQDLGDADRELLLLRYFKNHDFRAIGGLLGISDDTAQKRVSRALQKLRDRLIKRGVVVSASVLAGLMSIETVGALPVELCNTLPKMALAGKSVLATISTSKALVMTTFQKLILSTSAALIAGTVCYEVHENRVLSRALKMERNATGPQAALIEDLRRKNAEVRAQLERSKEELGKVEAKTEEINRLRNEVAALRADARETVAFSKGELPANAEAVLHARKIGFIKQKLEEMPEKKIPEMMLLTEDDWITAANKSGKLETDQEIRHAFTELRFAAKSRFAPLIMGALDKYAADHDGLLPPDTLKLSPYFEKPLPDSILQRYQVLYQGSLNDFHGDNLAITEKSTVDAGDDTFFQFGKGSYRTSNQSNPMAGETLMAALDKFKQANEGNLPKSFNELSKYWGK